MIWKQNVMWWRQTALITGKNKIDTVNNTDKPQAYKSKKYKSISNE